MRDIFQRYIDYMEAERNFSPYTVRNYTTDLIGSKKTKGYFQFLIDKGVTSLEEADRFLVRDYLSYLVENRVVKASIARKMSALRSFYKFLVREEILSVNPVEDTSSPKLDKRLPSFLTIKEIEKLLDAPDTGDPFGKRDRALLELLYASGLRVSELVSLDLGQVDFESREIRIIGKGSKERMVLIGEPAARALRIYLEEARDIIPTLRPIGGKPVKQTNAVFVNNNGGRLSERSVQTMLQRYAVMAGIGKSVHPHMLRHTFATHMLDGGADLRVVQELLGHADLSSTQIYTHVSKNRARKVYLSAHPMAKDDEKGDGIEYEE
ncbi:MAG: tyrosine recombinase XerC [Dehalococcoidales bacterium]|nr:tyrosine recombinase XerC [Dehalococcoidales bacterium]